MVAQFARPPYNPYPSGHVTGGTIPGDAEGHYVRDISEIVDPIEPQRTPLLQMIRNGGSVDRYKIEWLQRREKPHRTALGAALTAAATTMTVTPGDGAILQKYDVYEIVNASGAREVIWAGGEPAGDTATGLVRGMGDTTPLAFTGTENVEIIGTAVPYNNDFTFSGDVFGTFEFNYFQRFQDGKSMDLAYRYTPNVENKGDQLSFHLTQAAARQKVLLDKAIMRGVRFAGVPDPNPANRQPPMMGGIESMIKTNVTDMAGAPITFGAIEQELLRIREKYSEMPDTFLCSHRTQAVVSRLIKTRQASVDTTTVTLSLKKFEFSSGEVTLVPTDNLPDGVIYGLNIKRLTLYNYKNLNWHQREIPVFGDHARQTVSGDFTLKLTAEPTFFRLYNFSTDFADYPEVEFGSTIIIQQPAP